MNEDTKKVLEELKSGITQEVITELKNNVPLRKDILGGDNAKSELKEAKERTAEYLRAKYIGDSAKAKALGLTSTGGVELVPEYFSSEVIRLAPQYGVVRRYARNVPMQGLTQKIPTASSVTAYRVGHGAAATSSAPTTGRVTLTAEKVVALIPVENELLKDANVDTIDLLTRLAAEAIAKKEDIWGLKGEGAGEGIFQNTNVPVVTMASTMNTYAEATFDDLLDVMNALNEDALANAKWLMSFSVFNALRKIKAGTTGEYIMQPPSGGQPATIWNIPVIFSSNMPKTSDVTQASQKFVALANMDFMLFGDRKEYSIEISREATVTDTDGSTPINLFEQDMSAVKVMERVDIELAEADKAFAVLKTAAS
jgi:HK97 family phage major capsid protein